MRGRTPAAVKRAIDSGRISAAVDGRGIDPGLADELWAGNTGDQQGGPYGNGGGGRSKAMEEASRKKRADAEVAELRAEDLRDGLARRRGELVPKAEVFGRVRGPLEAVARVIDEMPRAMARRHHKRLKMAQGEAQAFFERLAEEMRAPLRAIFEEEG